MYVNMALEWRYLKYQVLIINVVKFIRKLINIKPGEYRPDRGRLHVGGIGVVVAGGPFGQTRFGLWGGCSRCSLLPSRALRVVRVARALVSVHPRPIGPDAAGRPRRGGSPAVVSESHPSGESGDTGAPPAGGLVAPPGPALGQVCAAGPSRRFRGRGGGHPHLGDRARRECVPRVLITSLSVIFVREYKYFCTRVHTENSDNFPLGGAHICGSSDLRTLLALHRG